MRSRSHGLNQFDRFQLSAARSRISAHKCMRLVIIVVAVPPDIVLYASIISVLVAILTVIFLPFHFPLSVLELRDRYPNLGRATCWREVRQILIGQFQRVEGAHIEMTRWRKPRARLECAQGERRSPAILAVNVTSVISATDELALHFRKGHTLANLRRHRLVRYVGESLVRLWLVIWFSKRLRRGIMTGARTLSWSNVVGLSNGRF